MPYKLAAFTEPSFSLFDHEFDMLSELADPEDELQAKERTREYLDLGDNGFQKRRMRGAE